MSRDATELRIGKALKVAAASLGRSFACASRDFWPASGNNDMAERHLTHHLAIAFAAEGYQPYFEVARRGQRVDLLVVRWQRQRPVHAVAVEAKLLYSADGRAAALARDVEKLTRWSPEDNVGHSVPTHRMVVASMWSDDDRDDELGEQRRALRDAWQSAESLTRSFRSVGWRKLARAAHAQSATFLHAEASVYGTERQHVLALVWGPGYSTERASDPPTARTRLRRSTLGRPR